MSQQELRFQFITPCFDEDFFKPVKKGMGDAAALMRVQALFTGTIGADIERQREIIKAAIDDGIDGLVISFCHPSAFNGVVQDAMGRNIPVLAFSNDTSDPNCNKMAAICQNVFSAGTRLAEYVKQFIPNGSKVLLTKHTDNFLALDLRIEGIRKVLDAKKISWQTLTTGNILSQAAAKIQDCLKNDKSLRYIICSGQADTEGAAYATEAADAELFVAGFDLSSRIIHALKGGWLKVTVDQQPYLQGFYPVVQLALYHRYGILPQNIDTGAGLVLKENCYHVEGAQELGYR